uniref:Uncharacterized protein LOC110218889 n=1 Tax=Phascolarctos cinereus TaxID=38626 RepID=A0A6P5LNM3_PHACI|nr:uncharacterized protein LOC110218889 [Phascolarctos cinereus]
MDKGVKKTFPSETGGTTQYRTQTSSLPKDEGKGRTSQPISHMPNSFDVLDSLLVKLSEEKNEPSHNQGIVNSRPLPSSLDPHHALIPMDDKQKISGKVLANFPQNFSLEEGKSKQHGVLGSTLTDYRSTEKPEPDVPVIANISLLHPSSHLEILPPSQTDLSHEQPKESKVKVTRKKKRKDNEDGKFLKRKREESFQKTVQCLLEMVEMMENIVQNLISRQRKSKP